MAKRRKSCEFCRAGVKSVDYKDITLLKRYVTIRGKLLSARNTGTCAYHQRKLARAVKRARIMALLPFVQSYYM